MNKINIKQKENIRQQHIYKFNHIQFLNKKNKKIKAWKTNFDTVKETCFKSKLKTSFHIQIWLFSQTQGLENLILLKKIVLHNYMILEYWKDLLL